MARLIYDGKNNKNPILQDNWSLSDITETAKLMKIKLSKKRAIQVMENIAKTFDAEIGINWDVIKANIDTINYLYKN
jgi:hypothetical protein